MRLSPGKIIVIVIALLLLAVAPGLSAVLLVGVAGSLRKKAAPPVLNRIDRPGPEPEQAYRQTRRPVGHSRRPEPQGKGRETRHVKPLEEYDSYTEEFQRYYYAAKDKGLEINPWELPAEKAPWER